MSKPEYLKIDSFDGKTNAGGTFPQLSSHPDVEERLPFHGLSLSSTLEYEQRESLTRSRRKQLIGASLFICVGPNPACALRKAHCHAAVPSLPCI